MIADAETSNTATKHAAIAGIAVADQVARCLFPAVGLRELIGDPLSRRMCRHAKPQDLSPAMPHNQESVEQVERCGRHHEQVHRSNATCMIAKKKSSSPAREVSAAGPCTWRHL